MRPTKPHSRNGHRIDTQTLVRLKSFECTMEEQRYSASTIKTYLSMLKQFFAYFEGRSWENISREDISEFNHQVFIVTGKSHSTQNQAINAIKLFYAVNGEASIVPSDFTRPRREYKLPNVLTKEEVAHILRSSGNLKHKTLLSLTYGCGMRIGEILDLKWVDVSRAEGLLYIRRAKGRKDRRVPLSKGMIQMLERYFHVYKSNEYIFEGQYGGKYSYSSSQQVIRRAVKRAGIRKHVTMHTLRHSYATHLLESGVGLRYIQEILGHNSPKTTMIYTHVSGKRLGEIRSPFDDLDL